MVGVPGKSKACPNCRKRRVQCDTSRPSCGQCQRSGLSCGGYHKEFIFVNSTSQESQDGSFSFERETYSVANRPKKETPSASTVSTPIASNISPTTNTADITPTTITTHTTPSLLHRSLEGSAYEDNIIGEFWNAYLPNGRSASKEVKKYSTYAWTGVAQDLYTKSPMVRVSLLASAMGLVSRQKNDLEMFRQGREAYGRALLAVEKALRDPDKHEVPAVLTALRLLSFYELWFGSDGDEPAAHYHRLKTHVSGNMAYLLMKGPEAFSEGDAHELFSECRLAQVIAGLHTREATPLANPEWKAIPWSKRQKTTRDTLIDILLDLPGLYEDAERSQALEDEQQRASARCVLREKCMSLHEKLQAWAETDGKKLLQLAELAVEERESESEPASHPRSSEEFAMGHLILLHYATRILLYDVLHSSADNNSTGNAPADADPLIYCRKMGKFIPFFLVPDTGYVFLNMAIFPIIVALEYLSSQEKTGPSTGKLLLLRAFRGHAGTAATTLLMSYQKIRKPRGRPILE